MLSYRKFIKKLEAGAIKNFKPYAGAPLNHLKAMAERGVGIDTLLLRAEPELIEILIENGHAQEHYEVWKHNSNKAIRVALAKQGLYPEFFIKDGQSDVRIEVMKKYPQYRKELIGKTQKEYTAVLDELFSASDTTDVELELLYSIRNDKNYQKQSQLDRESIEVKIAGMEQDVELLEATMSPYQLYTLKSPLWARNLTFKQIDIIIYGLDQLENAGKHDVCEKFFTEIVTASPELGKYELHHILWKY